MTDFAIRVENLGKLYRIGKRQPYRTLRDTLADAFAAPFRGLARCAKGLVRRAKSEEQRATDQMDCHDLNSKPHALSSMPDTIWALKNVSFEVKPGEVVGIIGRNGAGKSTLLKILSRITEPTEGRAEIRGRVSSLLEVGTGFHPELTGRENIYLNGAILGMTRAEIRRKFDEIVAFAEVEKFIDTPVKHYSSGMYVRLAFAVAAHLEPEILLVDEVLAVGDQGFQAKCMKRMTELVRIGATVLFVSHNMSAIEGVCGRVMWLSLGAIRATGPSRDVVKKYYDDIESADQTISYKSGPNKAPSGPLIVNRVTLRNPEGIATNRHYFGEDFWVEIDFTANSAIRNPIFSIGITEQGWRPLVLATMLVDGYGPPLIKGKGRIRCRFESPRLLPRRYEVWCSVRTEEGYGDIVDWHNAADLVVILPESSLRKLTGKNSVHVLRAHAPIFVAHSWEWQLESGQNGKIQSNLLE